MFHTKVVEKINTYISCSITFLFSQILCHLWDNVEKYSSTRQATGDNMAHAHCELDT